MKLSKRIISISLCFLMTLSLFAACGKDETPEQTSTHEAIAVKDMKIGILFEDNAVSTGDSYFHITGIEKAAETIGLDSEKQLFIKKNVTDVTFDENTSFDKVTEAEASSVTEDAAEPETFIDADGNPVVEAVPVKQTSPETAVQAVSSLLSDGCNVIIATSMIYDSFSQYVAKQNKDIVVIQFNGTGKDIPNLYNYSSNVFEGFYLAGAVAATVSESGNIGFISGIQNDEITKNINAFSIGVSDTNKDAKVTLRRTNVAFDLGLERTLPAELISADKCDIIVQSVYTALPQTVAENASKEYDHEPVPCIGFGYDMSADAQKMNVCSIIIDYSVFFTEILTALSEGKFANGSFVGTVENGSVYLSEFRSNTEKLTEVINIAKQKLSGDTGIFEGFSANENGFAINITVK